MDCHKIEEQLTSWLLGDLSPDESAEIERHVNSCEACRAASREIEPTLDLLRAVLAEPSQVPERLSPAHRRRVAGYGIDSQNSSDRGHVLPWLTTGHPRFAAVAALVLVGFFVVSMFRMPLVIRMRTRTLAPFKMGEVVSGGDASGLAGAPPRGGFSYDSAAEGMTEITMLEPESMEELERVHIDPAVGTADKPGDKRSEKRSGDHSYMLDAVRVEDAGFKDGGGGGGGNIDSGLIDGVYARSFSPSEMVKAFGTVLTDHAGLVDGDSMPTRGRKNDIVMNRDGVLDPQDARDVNGTEDAWGLGTSPSAPSSPRPKKLDSVAIITSPVTSSKRYWLSSDAPRGSGSVNGNSLTIKSGALGQEEAKPTQQLEFNTPVEIEAYFGEVSPDPKTRPPTLPSDAGVQGSWSRPTTVSGSVRGGAAVRAQAVDGFEVTDGRDDSTQVLRRSIEKAPVSGPSPHPEPIDESQEMDFVAVDRLVAQAETKAKLHKAGPATDESDFDGDGLSYFNESLGGERAGRLEEGGTEGARKYEMRNSRLDDVKTVARRMVIRPVHAGRMPRMLRPRKIRSRIELPLAYRKRTMSRGIIVKSRRLRVCVRTTEMAEKRAKSHKRHSPLARRARPCM